MSEPSQYNNRSTSYDVARMAGVSQSAVSRCFKPGASVSKKMREKVMEAAKALNYQPNAIARGLITRRSNLVAVLVSSQLNFYYPEALFQITDRLSKRGMRVLLFTINEESDVESSLDQVWQYQADGVISASYLSIEQHQLLESRNIPVIMFNRYFDAHPTTSIWCDPGPATDIMVKHMADFGHKKFALLEGPEYSMVNVQRMAAARKSIKKYDGEIVAKARGNYRYESAGPAVEKIMSAKDQPTALIVGNDMMAMGALDEVKSLMGLTVPGDISIAGFDGIGAARFASYELTTIRQPIGRMADAAVDLLMDRLEKPELSHEKRVLTGSFVQGTSTGPAKA